MVKRHTVILSVTFAKFLILFHKRNGKVFLFAL